jgi:hypothetical protein
MLSALPAFNTTCPFQVPAKNFVLYLVPRPKQMTRPSYLLALALICSVSPFRAPAQSQNQQVWFEYMLNYPFANSFNLENAFTYSELLTSPKWRSFDYSPTVEYSLTNRIDILAGGTLTYTNQFEDHDTFEGRLMIGTRIHFTPNMRILSRLQLRLEQRNFKDLELDTWETVYRPRARAEFLIPITRKTYFEDKLWYGILDSEFLFAVDEDVNERFANRFRLRIGIGYRLSYSSRFEFIYMLQESRSGLDESFESTDNVFRFRYKQYLRKTKPTKATGTGN